MDKLPGTLLPHNRTLSKSEALPGGGGIGSSVARALLSQFEAPGLAEKQEFVRELIDHLPPLDAGPLSDDVAAAAGDQLAAMIEEEERAS